MCHEREDTVKLPPGTSCKSGSSLHVYFAARFSSMYSIARFIFFRQSILSPSNDNVPLVNPLCFALPAPLLQYFQLPDMQTLGKVKVPVSGTWGRFSCLFSLLFHFFYEFQYLASTRKVFFLRHSFKFNGFDEVPVHLISFYYFAQFLLCAAGPSV